MQIPKPQITLPLVILTVASLGGFIGNMDRIARWWSSHDMAYAAQQSVSELEKAMTEYIQAQKEAAAAQQGYQQAIQGWMQQQQQVTPPNSYQQYQNWCWDDYWGEWYEC